MQQLFDMGALDPPAAPPAPPAPAEPALARAPRARAPRPRQDTLGGVALASALGELAVRHRGPLHHLVHGEAVQSMRALPSEVADLVFADPPYNLSNGGTTCRGGERVAVHKGDWDVSRGVAADHEFHRTWIAEARRVLKPTGTLWVSGTQHVIFSIGFALQTEGWNILNTVTWFKPNASPNLGCRQFTHSCEVLIWAAPAEYDPLVHTFNYEEMKAETGVQMRDMWSIPPPGDAEKAEGRHPTQKPLALLDRIVRASSRPGDLVIDPFNGSGTTGVAAVARGRRYVGVDLDAGYLDLTARRLATSEAR